MLIRIGDEKREMINAHIDVLKTKIVTQSAWVDDTEEILLQTLIKVIQNLPHKVFVYGALMGLIACESPEICRKLVNDVVNSTISTGLLKEQDAFGSRNVFRWLSYLVYLRAVSPQAAIGFLTHLLQEQVKNEASFQRDVVLDCIFTFLLCQDTHAQLMNCPDKQAYLALMNQLNLIMQKR